MIDAYTIGISLALDNGLSEGIAAIQRELAALDRAAESSAAGLRQLTAIAGELSPGASVKSSPTVSRKERPAVAPAEAQCEVPRAQESRISSPSTEVARISNPPASTVQPDVTGSLRMQPSIAPTPTVPPPLAEGRIAAEVVVQPPPVTPQAETVVREVVQPVRSVEQAKAPLAASSADSRERKAPRKDVAAAVPPQREHSVPAAPVENVAAADRAVPRGAPTTITVAPAKSVILPPVMAEPQSERAHAAPVATGARELKTYAPVQAARAEGSATTQQGRQQIDEPRDNVPSGGTITLDGMALGRWFSDYLTKKAGRASAGFSGFDGRMNPAPIGASINS